MHRGANSLRAEPVEKKGKMRITETAKPFILKCVSA